MPDNTALPPSVIVLLKEYDMLCAEARDNQHIIRHDAQLLVLALAGLWGLTITQHIPAKDALPPAPSLLFIYFLALVGKLDTSYRLAAARASAEAAINKAIGYLALTWEVTSAGVRVPLAVLGGVGGIAIFIVFHGILAYRAHAANGYLWLSAIHVAEAAVMIYLGIRLLRRVLQVLSRKGGETRDRSLLSQEGVSGRLP